MNCDGSSLRINVKTVRDSWIWHFRYHNFYSELHPTVHCYILFKQHFMNEWNVGQNFPTFWTLRSPEPYLHDFWLWGYLKSTVHGDNLNYLVELKDAIHWHVCNISPDMQRATVKNAVIWFNLLSENGGRHVEHALQHISDWYFHGLIHLTLHNSAILPNVSDFWTFFFFLGKINFHDLL